MAKSGTTIRVGTTVPGSQAHTPTVDRAVGGDSSNTQAQPGPAMCGNTGGLCAEAETEDSNRELREAIPVALLRMAVCLSVSRFMAALLWIINVLPKSHVEARAANRWHFWEVVEP